MSNQKIVIIIGIIILVVIGWWSFGSSNQMIDENTNTENEENVIPNTNTGTQIPNTSAGTNTNVTANPNAIAPVPTEDSTASNNNGETTPATNGPEMHVRYTNIGFLPKSLTVEEGTTVTFTNESTGGMWVASDNHPSHSILPDFNQNEVVSAGGTYSYTFTKAGQWGFHNHMRPEHEGIILVNVK